MVLRFFGEAANPEQLRHRFSVSGRPLNEIGLLRAAKALGLKASVVNSTMDRLPRTPLPAIASHRDGRWMILAKASGDKVLVHDPLEPAPHVMTAEEFAHLWSGRLLLVTHRAQLSGATRRFDFTWFIPSIFRYRKIFGEVLLASFFLQLFALVTPLFFQVVIDKVLVHRGLSTLDVLVLGLIIVTVFETFLGGLRAYVFSHTTNRVDVELGARLFHHTLSLPMAYFHARRVGDTVARARELENVRSFVTGSALTVILDLFFAVIFLLVMYVYSPLLTLVVMATIPLYIAVSAFVTPILRRRIEEKFTRGAENQAFLVEFIAAVETLKAMAVEPRMQQRWEEQLAAYVTSAFRASNLAAWAGQIIQMISKLTIAITLWFGAKLVIEGALTVGELVAFNMLASRVSAPILRLAQLWQDFQQVRVSVERLGDILNAAPESLTNASQTSLPVIKGRITLEHVSFRYRLNGPRVIEDVCLDIPAGQILGIVGPSGSGKSTVTKLIQRLHSPEAGRIMIDGIDHALVDPAWLRHQVGVVLQENTLFNRSIRDNIAFADPGLPMDRIVEATKLAGAHDFVLELPNGYDTVIGERGATLSGGQRQRIAIARALITNPRVLILDEATSALDYESERVIQDNMRAICKGRTVIIIAHRLAAVRIADRILTIERGRVSEDGTHEELLRRGGRYAALYRHQIGLADAASAGAAS